MTLYSKSANSKVGFDKKLFLEVEENVILSEFPQSNYKPVYFVAYARTDYDNLVLLWNNELALNIKYDAGNMTPSLYLNLFDDVGLFCGKSLLDNVFSSVSVASWQDIAKKSTCYPVGAVETEDSFYVVFNVVLSVDLLRRSDIELKVGYTFSPIETYATEDTLCKAISKSLVIVKDKE